MTSEKKKDVEWGKRLQQLRDIKNLSQKELAASEIDLSYPTIQRYESGILPSAKKINEIVKYFKCSKVWLLTGEGVPYPDLRGPETGVPITIVEPELSQDEFVFVGHMKGEISGGQGIAPENAIEDMRVAFRKEWIKKKGDPINMSIIKVRGDSMEPTLFSGDHVLVDHGKNYVQPQGGIYAISINNEIMIKRIQVLYPQGKIAIISDNKNYERLEMDASQVHINGKVIWFCRDIER